MSYVQTLSDETYTQYEKGMELKEILSIESRQIEQEYEVNYFNKVNIRP